MWNESQTPSCQHNPDDPIAPDPSSGVLRSGSSFGATDLKGLRRAPRKRVGDSDFLPMPYLNLDPDFFGHPKYLRLVSALGDRAEGYLLRLWCHAAKYHPVDGVFAGYTDAEIARISGWVGDSSQLVEALVAVRFVDRSDAGFVLHDWHDHQGHLAYLKKRALLGAKARWDKLKRGDAKAMLKQCLSKQSAGKERKGKVRVLRTTGGVGGFQPFWITYPRKVGRVAALKAWDTLAPSAELAERMIQAVLDQKCWPQWLSDGGRFIPHPATWIRGRRWEDQPPTEAAMVAGGAKPRSVADALSPEQRDKLKSLTRTIGGPHDL